MLLGASPDGTSIFPATRQPSRSRASCTRSPCSGPTVESVKIAQSPGSSELEKISARSTPAPTKTLYGWVTETSTASTGTPGPPQPPSPAGAPPRLPLDLQPLCRKGDVQPSAARN